MASGNSSAYTGAVALSGGALEANNASNAFGTGTLALNGGTVSAINQATTLSNSSVTVGNGDTATFGGTQNITVTPGIATGNSSSALNVTNTGTTTLSSALTGAGALNQSAGTLVASGNGRAYTVE